MTDVVRSPRRVRVGAWVGLALVLSVMVGFIAFDPGRLSREFGMSHDGFNGSVWAIGAHALREHGPLQSVLGARGDWGTYATHPPLLYSLVASAEVILGVTTFAARLPVILGSLALGPLLFVLLRRNGLSPVASGVGIAAGLGTPMFLVYGAVNDTLMVSVSLGVGVLVLWEFGRTGLPLPRATAFGAALAVLASWQALALVAGAAVISWSVDRKATPLSVRVALTAGLGAGVALTIVYIAWAYGWSLSALHEIYNRRRGESVGITVRAALENQRLFLRPLLWPWWILGIAGAGLLLRPRKAVWGILTLLAVVGYAYVFKGGALFHAYWMYWLVVPLAAGAAFAGDAVLRAASRWRFGHRAVAAVLVWPGVLAIYTGARSDTPDEQSIRSAAEDARLYSAVTWPPSQRRAYVYGAGGATMPPVIFYAKRPMKEIDDLEARRLAVAEPDALIIDLQAERVVAASEFLPREE